MNGGNNMNWLQKIMQSLPTEPRPNRCPSSACVGGYIRVPDFESGQYRWVPCKDSIHDEPEKIQCVRCGSDDLVIRDGTYRCRDCKMTGSL